MPTAMSFTLGRLQTTACSSPNPAPIAPATSTPSHGEPVRYAIAYPLMAPITSVPSSPRFTRPLFSVSVSPRLT